MQVVYWALNSWALHELFLVAVHGNIYLSTDYFETWQIIFGNNMNTIEMH